MDFKELFTRKLLDLNKTIAAAIFEGTKYPWESLNNIHDFILRIGSKLPCDKFEKIGENIWISKTAQISDSASLNGPLIIDENAEIRHCAFVRKNVIIGKDSVVGNSTELKNVILFDNVQVPHYNYIGDSILGYNSHLGAGAITSNVKSDKSEVMVCAASEKIKTGLKKFGAIVGDFAEVGCNAVLNPGTIIGRNSIVYPVSSVRGMIPEGSIYKSKDNCIKKKPCHF